MSPTLPVELAQHVIDFLHAHPRALAACALVSHALLPTARFHLWHDLTVHVQAHPAHAHIRRLLDILDFNPEIAPLVRSLTLKGTPPPQLRDCVPDSWEDSITTTRLWERFPNLRVLKFASLRFNTGLHQLLPVAYSLPNLEELAVTDSTAFLSGTVPTRPSYLDSVVQLTVPPQLKRLRIVGGAMSRSFLEDLAKLLLEPGMHPPLEALDLSCTVNSSNFKFATHDRTHTLPTRAWAPVIASVQSTLRHCTLGLLAVECSPENIASLYGTLEQCTGLRSLGIKCNIHPIRTFPYRPFLFVDMLADLLLPTPGPSPSDTDPDTPPRLAPFPNLEALSLEWRQPSASEPLLYGCADACKKLARALEDRKRYPCLTRLDVRSDTGRGGTVRLSEEHAQAQEALLRSCLGQVAIAGVRLDIEAA